MQYKYKGTNYELILNSNGKIYCQDEDLGLIEGDSAAEVQEKIKKAFAAAHDPKYRIKILTFGEHWNNDGTRYFEGTTTGIHDHGVYWVSWKDQDGDQYRRKLHGNDFWKDSPENRARLDQIVLYQKQIDEIIEKKNAIMDELEGIKEDNGKGHQTL